MNIVNVSENVIANKYILITQESDINEYITNNVFVTDDLNRSTNVVEVSRGIQGFQGPAGKDGVVFDILPIISGGTNNSSFTTNKIVYYDGNKLTSSNYSLSDIITGGVLAGTGVVVVSNGGVVTVHSNLGSGLTVNANNQIVVDFNSIDQRVLQQLTITAGSGLVYTGGTYHIGKSSDIQVNADNIELTPTGTAGTYSKITTDSKGRVINGQNLSSSDITTILGYTPWHAGNDGQGSELDADKLDGMQGSYLRNAGNLTGILNSSVLPSSVIPGSYSKVVVSQYGVITSGSANNYSDITGSLGYRPVSNTGDTINGTLFINGSIFSGSIIRLYDNLPIVANNHFNLDPSDPRGFRFLYGGSLTNPKTGILAYYPGSKTLRLTAETSDIIITDRLASGLYASLTGTNSFSGINTFLSGVYINQLYISGIYAQTTGLATNLNADLLDGKHGASYHAAQNLTGILNQNSYVVSIVNISGTPNYLSKFDNRTSNPSRTVSNSIISENSGDVRVENGNLFIGIENNAVTGTTQNSLIVGSNNLIKDVEGALALGYGNIASGDYSIAGNYEGLTKKPYSVALGKNGITWAENQLAFGMFKETTGIDSGDGQGQHSVIGLSYYGTAANYVNLLPKLILPKNKTFLYNLDILMTKLGSSGCAAFKFESGVVRNITRRMPDNLSVEENVTLEVKPATKKVVYNDSYLRDYVLAIELDETYGYDTTKIKVDKSPLTESPFLNIQNLNNNIMAEYKPISLHGHYINDQGHDTINVYLDKPKISGSFLQQQDDFKITISSYDHKAVTGTEVDIDSINIVGDIYNRHRYIVTDIIDEDSLKVSSILDNGEITSVDGSDAYLSVSSLFSNSRYENSNYIYLRYFDNNSVISDTYSLFTNLGYDSETQKINFIIPNINNSSGDMVLVAPADFNAGQCSITPKRNFTGVYSQTEDVSRYTALKAEYVQYPSVSGKSNVVITGINKDNNEAFYYSWENSIVSGSIQNTGTAYFEFIKFIDTTYFTTGDFRGSGVTGIVVNTSYGDIRGFYNAAPLSDNTFRGEVSGFIESLNGSSLNQIIKSSGGHINFGGSYGDFIFFPYNTGSIPPIGSIRICENESYRSGQYPKNGSYKIKNYDYENNTFNIDINYDTSPNTGYATTGFMDIYLPIPKIASITINNVNPTFNRNFYNERCYLNFDSNNIVDDNYTIINDNNPLQRSSFRVDREYYYPNNVSGVAGSVRINADRDHGLLENSNEVWRYTPLVAMSGSGSVPSSQPYNSVYTVTSVTGDLLVLDEIQNHLRNEASAKFRFGTTSSFGSGSVVDGVSGVSINKQNYELENDDLINIKSFKYLYDINGVNSLGLYRISGSLPNNQFFAYPIGMLTNQYYSYTGIFSFSKVATGICRIPQNNIYFNTNISANNLYNRWGKNDIGNAINQPILAKYTIHDLTLKQEMLNSGIANQLFYLVRDAYSLKEAHNTHIQQHLDDNRVFDVVGTGNVVDGTVSVYEGGGNLSNTQIVLDNAEMYFNFSGGGILSPDYATPTNEWNSTYSSQYLETYTQKELRNKILQCFPRTFCIAFSNYAGYSPSEYDSLFISFDRPNDDLNSIYSISSIESDKFYVNIRQDQAIALLSKINNNSINLPYEGFAEIIPFHTTGNLINKNPNQSNILYKPYINQITKSGAPSTDLSFMIGKHNQIFDNFTKRQLHAVEFNLPATIVSGEYRLSGQLPSVDPYLIQMTAPYNGASYGSDKVFNLLVNSIKPIQIDGISWIYMNINDGWNGPTGISSYVDLTNNIIELFNNRDWNLRIKTKNGTYSTGIKPIAPAVDIFGIKNYTIKNLEFNRYDENYLDGYWTIDVNCSGFNFSNDRDIIVRVQDHSGSDSINLNIKSNPRLVVKNIVNNTIYSNTNSVWYNLINIYGVPSTEFSSIGISVTSGGMSSYSWEPSISGFSYLISGLSPSSIQNFAPIYNIEYSGQSITRSGTNQTTSSIPVELKTYNFDSPVVFSPTCNSYIIPIIIPNTNNNISNLNVSVGGVTATSISVGYSSSLKRYLAQIYLNSNTPFGLYPCSFTFTYNSTNSVVNKDIIFADTLRINKSDLSEPLSYNINTPWELNFKVVGGEGTNNSTYPAKVNLFNTPIIGYYTLNNLDQYQLESYKLSDTFESGTQDHRILATGLKTIYDNHYYRSSGLQNIYVYAEDNTSYCSGLISINVFENPYISNLEDVIYTHFNRSASFAVDSKYANNLSISKNTEGSELPGGLNVVKRYDLNRDLYNNYVNTSLVTGIWNAEIVYENDASEDNTFYSTTKLTPKCRAILNDRVYISAKLTALEVSNSYIRVPIKISNLENPISVAGGQPWKISFNTCYGLADNQYPPTIYISGAPTSCSGVASSVPDEQIPNGCISIRSFNNNTKCWYFEFDGQPLCNAASSYNVFVQAIDTVDGTITVGSDNASTTLLYGELPAQKPPELTQTNLIDSPLYPKCSMVSIMWSGSIANRDVCPIFTGIRQIRFIGNGLPAGLNISIDDIYFKDGTRYDPQTINYAFSNGNGINPYGGSGFFQVYTFSGYESDISGVRGYISGTPTEFFDTPYSLTGIILDGRDLDGVTLFSFNDSSEPISYPLQYTTVYFGDSNYVDIPSNDALLLNSTNILSPPAHPESFQYSGILSNQNGPHSGIYYRSDSINQIITISGLNRSINNNISAGSKAYIQFNNLSSSNTKSYVIVSKLSSDAFTIYSPSITTSFNNRTGCVVVFPSLQVDSFGNFGGSPLANLDNDTNGKLLGAGIYNSAQYKISGTVRPSYVGYLSSNQYDEGTSITLDTYNYGLSIEPLDGVCCDHSRNSITYKNCYETGVARISGVILPKPSLEVTDPPPSTPPDYAFYNQSYGLNIRLAYGSDANQKNDVANRRGMFFQNNRVSGLFYVVGQNETLISSDPASSINNDLGSINFSYTDTSGQILHLKVLRQSDKFPTINQFAIPYVDNDYYWIFASVQTDNNDDYLITGNREIFPPYIPIKIPENISFISGNTNIVSGNIIGGFIHNASNIYPDNRDKDYLVQGTYWSYSGYKPICSGILSQPLFQTYSGICLVNPSDPSVPDAPSVIQLMNINSQIVYSGNDILILKRLGEDPVWNFPSITGIQVTATGNYPLTGPAVSGNLISLESPIYSNQSGYFNITKGVSFQKTANNDYRLYPKYSSLALNNSINLLPINENADYSQILLSATGNMYIVSGDANNWYARSSKYTDLNSYPNTGYAYIYKIINNSPMNPSLSYNKIGLWNAVISGSSSQSLDLDYKYQILTIDNTGLPILSGLGWSPYKFGKTYDLHINKPFEIYSHTSSTSELTHITGFTNYGSPNFTSTFYIKNGVRPLIDNPPLIEIDNNKYGFSYNLSYNDYYDMYKVNMVGSTSDLQCVKVSNSYNYKELNLIFIET